MISVIICSRNRDIPEELRNNIETTIGIEYELIVIDNSQNKYDIFTAYNEGISRSEGEILCFMHEDVLFRTQNWGRIVFSHFENTKGLGVLGVAGSHFLPSVPMYWSSSPFISEHNLNLDNGKLQNFFHDDFFRGKNSVEAVCVDGLCFFIHKDSFSFMRFDDQAYSGFHLYDMDICMQAVSNGYSVIICNDILVQHAWSEAGSKNKKGYEVLERNLDIFIKKWKDELPIVRGISLPEYSVKRLDGVYKSAHGAKLIRISKVYRLGRLLLKPFRLFSK